MIDADVVVDEHVAKPGPPSHALGYRRLDLARFLEHGEGLPVRIRGPQALTPGLVRAENKPRPVRPQRRSGRHRDSRHHHTPWMFANSLAHCRGGATRIQPCSTRATIGEQYDIKGDILEKCQSHSHDFSSTRIYTIRLSIIAQMIHKIISFPHLFY